MASSTELSSEARHFLFADEKMASIISTVGVLPQVGHRGPLLRSMARIVVGQQLSTAAARTIFLRLSDVVDLADARAYLRTSNNTICKTGVSRQKEESIRGIAQLIHVGDLSWDSFDDLCDQEAFELLQTFRGFGPWSAEMFLIFELQRPNIFSMGDAGLRRAICKLYDVDPRAYDQSAPEIVEKWAPFKSTACRYLWRWLDGPSDSIVG